MHLKLIPRVPSGWVKKKSCVDLHNPWSCDRYNYQLQNQAFPFASQSCGETLPTVDQRNQLSYAHNQSHFDNHRHQEPLFFCHTRKDPQLTKQSWLGSGIKHSVSRGLVDHVTFHVERKQKQKNKQKMEQLRYYCLTSRSWLRPSRQALPFALSSALDMAQ